MTPRSLINPKSIRAAIEYFFGRGELSQVVDQTNPLAQLTHERRLSALGPGRPEPQAGRLRGPRRAHLALRPHLPDRDARRHQHRPDLARWASTPASTSTASSITPYRKVKHGKLHRQGRAGCGPTRRSKAYLAPADAPTRRRQAHEGPRHRPLPDGDFHTIPRRPGPVHGHLAQADGRRLGRPDPVPRARRRQPRPDGLEHAAPGGAAADHRAADRRHRAGDGRRA